MLTLELFPNVVFHCELSSDLRLLLISVEIRFDPIGKGLKGSFYIFNLLLEVIFSFFLLCCGCSCADRVGYLCIPSLLSLLPWFADSPEGIVLIKLRLSSWQYTLLLNGLALPLFLKIICNETWSDTAFTN